METTDSLTLGEVLTSLERNNISVAIDLSVHAACHIDSNCPYAIHLRKIISDAGLTIIDIAKGVITPTVEEPEFLRLLPDSIHELVNAELILNIAGKEIKIPFEEALTEELQKAVNLKIYYINNELKEVRNLGRSLAYSYQQAVREVRRSKKLEQLSFPAREMMEHKCFVTCSPSEGHYQIYFPFIYQPVSLVNNGTTYSLHPSDISAIRREAILVITANADKVIINARLLDKHMEKLLHYHGNRTYDCWGTVSIEERWDGNFQKLLRYQRSLIGALATINYNSPLLRQPPGMPDLRELKDRATVLGREGVSGDSSSGGRPPATRGWGRAQREQRR